MHRKAWKYPILSAVFLLCSGTSRAQLFAPTTPPPPQKGVVASQDVLQPAPPMFEHVELMGFEGMHMGKVVTGAPFSATSVTETVQTLKDNRIDRQMESKLYRDAQGRFRRESTMPAIGHLAASGHPHSFVMIQDPVAGVHYMLEPNEKIARKFSMPPAGMHKGLKDKIQMHPQASTWNSSKREDLGTKSIDGLTVHGTSYTITIPAEQIGNQYPIVIVSEQWYSSDLQMTVQSTRNDPRFGITTYTLKNIQRTEPDASLFVVPADYTVKEGKHGAMGGMIEVPPPPPPPGE